ncbi:MAG TPA: type II toxin-antitoxin system HicB family antitoxin [Armatimonadota bacterium]|jgi:predicted RNase H-like HicB family nuclease
MIGHGPEAEGTGVGIPYEISIRPIKPEDGGGYLACIPQLGAMTFQAVGETPTEAEAALEELYGFLLPRLKAEGVAIPPPDLASADTRQYSGKLLLRIPKDLHARLVDRAEESDCSLNQFVTSLLSRNLEHEDVVAAVRAVITQDRCSTCPLKTVHPVFHRQDWPRIDGYVLGGPYDRAS